jgi:hypothetical protein
MLSKNLKESMFGIKLVWPGWVVDDPLADVRVGFPRGYDKLLTLPVGSKMLIYVTEYQRIMAINIVIGTWDEGSVKYSPSGKFPLCLPVNTPLKANYGLSKSEIKSVVPRFNPHEGLSYFPISKEEFFALEKLLISNG